MSFQRFIDYCTRVYDSPQIIAGPDGRDGASVYQTDSETVIAFRGTITDGTRAAVLGDWLNDLHADLVSDPRFPGRVHSGFLSSLSGLWPAISTAADGFSASGRTLFITGHSKGGALAFLAGHLLAERRPVVVTFAAPRVGDGEFAAAYSVPTYRFENLRDRVPRLPVFRYASCGMACLSPLSFQSPEAIRPAHSLETGYRPWVI